MLMCAVAMAVVPASAQRLEIGRGERATTQTARHSITGVADPDATLTVNGKQFPVYPTGGWAAEVMLEEGKNSVSVVAVSKAGRVEKNFDIELTPRPEKEPLTGIKLLECNTVPADIKAVTAGERIALRAVGTPGCKVSIVGGCELTEVEAGVYQGLITAKKDCKVLAEPLQFKIEGKDGSATLTMKEAIEVIDPNAPVMLRTVGDLPYLNYGLGTDRLGGSKIGHITEGILLEAVGKVGNQYKVRLSKNRTAYIPASCVEVQPAGTLPAQSLVGSWSVRGGKEADVVRVSLTERLPFATFHQLDPARVVVDIFGAVANTSWLTQYPETKNAIKSVDYEQVEEDIFRVIITLDHNAHWGHSVRYEGNSLIIRVKAAPKASLRGLHVAIDAGHGGPYKGAVGVAGVEEKDVNLDLAHMLREALEKRGAKVTMTRTEDVNVDMSDRVLMLRKADPNMMISIHCNAGGSPLKPLGTSTYYRHPGFQPLSTAVLKRVLELDMNNFGNIGSFNFILNSPYEYPNMLLETLFISAPAEEARLVDPKFRRDLIDRVVKGMEDYLKEYAK